MKRLDIIVKNSIVGVISQGFAMLIQIILRTLLLRYVGIELLGINGTLASVLSTLMLGELGFQLAIVYHLYKPIAENNKEHINNILNVLRVIYFVIGVVFIIAAVFLIPLLPIILKGVLVDANVLSIFMVMVLNIAASYFIAYKRALLYANQKEYISKSIDMICNLVFFSIKLLVVVKFRNYILFLCIQVFQTVLSNVIINILCKKMYPFLQRSGFQFALFKNIFISVKNIFGGKIAFYIYNATDNLIISSMVGVLAVGYLTNYVTLANAIKTSVSSIFTAMTSVIGNMMVSSHNKEKNEENFLVYAHLRYIFASFIIIPWFIFIEYFIILVFGEQYVLPKIINILLGIDLYIHMVYSVCCEYIDGSGLFKIDKNCAIIGAIVNIVISIILCAQIGVPGVLYGTIVSQFYFWIARSNIVYRKIFLKSFKEWMQYGLKNICWTIITILTIMILMFIQKQFKVTPNFLLCLLEIVCCEVIYLVIYILTLGRQREGKAVTSFLLQAFIKN